MAGPLQGTAPPTDFGYAGMLYNIESGLYLTNFRAYDPLVGRWLSRDPIGEESDAAANLYAYVGGDPIGKSDPTGECPWCVAVGVGAGIGAAASLAGQLLGNGGRLDCIDWGEVGLSALGGAALGGVGRFGALGKELSIGRNLRVAPFGNRTGHPTGKWPHYHRRSPDPKTGQSPPGQGIKRHRPWDKKPSDKSFGDRF
jgi:RHS repeat-associated protein